MEFKLTKDHIQLLESAKQLLIKEEQTYICHAIRHADAGNEWPIVYEFGSFSTIANDLLNYIDEQLYPFRSLYTYLNENYRSPEVDYWIQEMRICWVERIIYLILFNENKLHDSIQS